MADGPEGAVVVEVNGPDDHHQPPPARSALPAAAAPYLTSGGGGGPGPERYGAPTSPYGGVPVSGGAAPHSKIDALMLLSIRNSMAISRGIIIGLGEPPCFPSSFCLSFLLPFFSFFPSFPPSPPSPYFAPPPLSRLLPMLAPASPRPPSPFCPPIKPPPLPSFFFHPPPLLVVPPLKSSPALPSSWLWAWWGPT